MKSYAVKVVCAAAVTVFMVWPVHAQLNSKMASPDAPAKTQDQIEREKQLELKYKESLRSIPDAKTGNDPWSNVRNTEADVTPAPKPVAKPSRPKSAKRAATTAAASPWPAPRQSPPPWPGTQSPPPWPTPR
jgi:hypothetical protein